MVLYLTPAIRTIVSKDPQNEAKSETGGSSQLEVRGANTWYGAVIGYSHLSVSLHPSNDLPASDLFWYQGI